MPTVLRLILGDQLNHQHSWFDIVDNNVLYVMMEVRQETDYVTHHVQKILAFFLAMRLFRDSMTSKGHNFIYLTLDDPENDHDINTNILHLINRYNIEEFQYMSPDEYRVFYQLKSITTSYPVKISMVSSEHFLCSPAEFSKIFKNKKTYLMETFYREMRKKFSLLLEEDGSPINGKWNFDAENRKKIPENIDIPPVTFFKHDVKDLISMLHAMKVKTIGNIPQNNLLTWPVTREEGLFLLDEFINKLLSSFGTYQDAMTDKNWHLFHSRLSFVLNSKLLKPLEVIKAVESYSKKLDHKLHFSAVEGFIRQIAGWREYMRCIYWLEMPEFASLNYFNHQRPLPEWYWTGDTKMKCLSHAISQSLDHAYAHHIQRLMITGNFALLAGIHPDEVDQWYLGIYIDALEWVEITNTRGMSQFADGGIIGTKPYVSSSNYIDKMSDYCKKCHYNQKLKTGPGSCPFNSLYWHFYERNKEKLRNNPRIGMAYITLEKMNEEDKNNILSQAEYYLKHIDSL